MWDLLEFLCYLGDGLRIIGMLAPVRKFKGESLYWPVTGILLLIGAVIMIILGYNSEEQWPVYGAFILLVWLFIHLAIRHANVKSHER